jgi:hypothetical protein
MDKSRCTDPPALTAATPVEDITESGREKRLWRGRDRIPGV